MSDLKIASDLRLQIEYVSPGSLIANELNPKMHPDRQINALVRAIDEVGFIAPVIIDRNNGIVAGHARVLAALKVGITTIPAVRVEHLDDHQLRALMLADNRLSELGKVDQQLLAANLKLLTVEGIDLDIEAATAFTMEKSMRSSMRPMKMVARTRTMHPSRSKRVSRSIALAICGTWELAIASSARARSTRQSGMSSWTASRRA
jgi:hypothetical protein